MKTQWFYTVMMTLLIQGCSSDPDVDSSSSLSVAAAGQGVMYQHAIERSRFKVGDAVRHEQDGAYDRLIGSKGVFFRDTITNAVLAVPHAMPTELLPQPLTESAEQHNKVAAAYLLGAGVPAGEVSGTHVTTTMMGGTDRGQPASGKDRLLWYTTHLERSVAGIPVESSFAYAALDSHGDVIEEGVHWPAIPADVVAEAVALKQQLGAEGRAGFLAAVESSEAGAGTAAGEVKIVHSPPTHHGAFEVRAVYTVNVAGKGTGMSRVLRFDGRGQRVRLAHELDPVKAPRRILPGLR